MEKPRNPIASGFAALAGWRTTLVLLASANLAALPVPMALRGSLSSAFGDTLAGAAIRGNAQPDAGLYWIDYLRRYHPFSAASGAFWLAVALTLLFQIFLAGGIIETVGRERTPFLGEFFGACGRHFRHNLAAFLLFVLFVLLLPGVWLGLTGAAAHALFSSSPPHTPAAAIVAGVRYVVALLLFAALSMAYDFARAMPRFGPVRAWPAFRGGLAIARREPAGVLGIFFFWLIAAGLLQLGWSALEWRAAPASAGAIAVVFLAEQAGIWIRCAARVATWGSIVSFLGPRAQESQITIAIPTAPAPRIAGAETL
jgi:hypothetical protein